MTDSLKTFPSSDAEALAMLYIQNQDIKGLSPEQLAELYVQTLRQVRKHLRIAKANARNEMD